MPTKDIHRFNNRLLPKSNVIFSDLFDLYYDNRLVTKEKKDAPSSEYYHFVCAGSCFKEYGEISTLLRNTSLPNILRANRITVHTHCPLFQWILCNEENRRLLRARNLLPSYDANATSEVNGFRFMSFILKKLKIKPEILNEAKRRIGWESGKKVNAIHIRIGRHRGFQDNSFFLLEDDIPRFAQCASKFDLIQNNTYLASDSPIAKAYYSNRTAFPGYIVSSTVAKHTEGSVNRTIFTEAFTDMITMSLCSSLIGTWRSSYTTVTGAFQGNIPYYILRGWSGACRENSTVLFGWNSLFEQNSWSSTSDLSSPVMKRPFLRFHCFPNNHIFLHLLFNGNRELRKQSINY